MTLLAISEKRLPTRPHWLKEYALSLGLIFCIAAVILIQYRITMITLLAVGLAFLLLSMVFAIREPPHFK